MPANPRLYKFLKTFWLLAHAAIMPCAIAFLVINNYLSSASPQFNDYVIRITVGLLVVAWIIGMCLISMYKFPLKTNDAAKLILTTVLQFIVIFAVGGNVLFALYSSFLSSLTAIAILILIMAWAFVFLNKKNHKLASFALFLTIIISLVIWIISDPFWDNLGRMAMWHGALSLFITLSNIANIVAGFYKISIFSGEIENRKEYDAEWEKWAPATVITFILSTVAAFVVGGILQA